MSGLVEWGDSDRRDAALERLAGRIAVQPHSLTPDELAVVFVVSHGVRHAQAGEMLGRSVRWVQHRMDAAKAKLDASSNAHAVATALRLRLIS